MSLLMQALKKAEHAKQKSLSADELPSTPNSGKALEEALTLSPKEQALEQMAVAPEARDKNAFPPSTSAGHGTMELALSPQANEQSPPPVRAEPVLTSQEMPSADNAGRTVDTPAQAPADRMERRQTENTPPDKVEQPAAAPENPPRPALPGTGAGQQQAAAQDEKKIAAAQQKARSVFVSKQPVGKRRSLLARGAAITVLAMLTILGYFYWQITVKSSTSLMARVPVAPPPLPVTPVPAPEAAAPVVASTAAPAASPAPASPEAPAPAQRAPQTPQMPQIAADVVTPVTVPATASAAQSFSEPPNKPAAAKPPAAQVAQAPDSQAIQIRQNTIGNQINPALQSAYQSFLAGDAAAAQQDYQKVLQQEPNNRDALLGMAAIAVNRKQPAEASAHYVRLLELDPADADAIAGLTGLEQGDPIRNESRLKKILAQNPQAGAVSFALGNLYAQQSRWADAQQTYFQAYSSAPGNPDYAFNLAVSLDRLSQGKLAQDYYQKALALMTNNPGNFSKSAVRSRIRELQFAADN